MRSKSLIKQTWYRRIFGIQDIPLKSWKMKGMEDCVITSCTIAFAQHYIFVNVDNPTDRSDVIF